MDNNDRKAIINTLKSMLDDDNFSDEDIKEYLRLTCNDNEAWTIAKESRPGL